MKLSEEQCEEIAVKIDNEGFDYYFTTYGPDEALEKVIGKEIAAYKDARENLMVALKRQGVELEY